MNKEEAKQKLHNLAFAKLDTKPDDLKLADVMQIVNQIDEPQKPVVPQFVADWIEYVRGWNKGLLYALANSSDEVLAWLCVDKLKRQDLFARAWLDGYTVEEEKRYLVKMKGLCIDNTYLKQQLMDHSWYFGCLSNSDNFSTYHTRKQLEEAGFGWVFDCEGVEVEEVRE